MGWEFGKQILRTLSMNPGKGFILETWKDGNLNINIKNIKKQLSPKNIHAGYWTQVINKTQMSSL